MTPETNTDEVERRVHLESRVTSLESDVRHIDAQIANLQKSFDAFVIRVTQQIEGLGSSLASRSQLSWPLVLSIAGLLGAGVMGATALTTLLGNLALAPMRVNQ